MFSNYSDLLEIDRKFRFEKNQFYVMIMKSVLERSQYVIKMDFRAWLTDDLAGLYKSSYKRKNGAEVYVPYINNTLITYLEYSVSFSLPLPKGSTV